VEAGVDRPLEVVENGSSLLGAGGHRRPDQFGPLATGFASRSLGDAQIDHHETNGLLSQVVGR